MTLKHEPTSFWFVWTKKGHVPRFSHDSRDAAVTEAERLAILNPGKKYIVLSADVKVSA